jgi:cytoskeletal protein RodZ
MPTVGRTLALERTRQGLDLEDIAERTKIAVRTLKQIEKDEFESLPGMIFARNFVRQYAECLRMNQATVVEQFNREQQMPEPAFTVPEARFHVPHMRPSVVGRVFDNNTVSAFVTFVLTIVVCAAAYYSYQYWQARRQAAHEPVAAARAPAATPPPAAKPQESPPVPAPAAPAPPSAAEPAPLDSPAVAPGTGGNVHVVVSADEPCWTQITADGKVLFAGTLSSGETKMVNASAVVSVRAGNAGAIKLKLNGNDVAPIGPKGQIRVVTLTPSGAQVRTPTPVSEPL